MTNSIVIVVTLKDNLGTIVVNEDYPHTSESERMKRAQEKACHIFQQGIFRRVASNKMQGYPPHQIKEVEIESK